MTVHLGHHEPPPLAPPETPAPCTASRVWLSPDYEILGDDHPVLPPQPRGKQPVPHVAQCFIAEDAEEASRWRASLERGVAPGAG